ncbi:MAG: hypothetical protein ACXVIY_03155 [Mucilaginibacter sp.]
MCADLKYTIKRKLYGLPGEYRDNFYLLCVAVKRSIKTVNHWMDVKKGDAFSIPSDEFYLIADFLQCSPTELING